MTHASYDSLLATLGTAIRSADQGGNTSAADVRGFLTALLTQLVADTAPVASTPVAFGAIRQNQYGTHPAFSDQATLNAWLLGHSVTAASSYGSAVGYGGYYGGAGYTGINAYLLAPAK
ncbi:hypothetical protein [Hymenobacter arcticus]